MRESPFACIFRIPGTTYKPDQNFCKTQRKELVPESPLNKVAVLQGGKVKFSEHLLATISGTTSGNNIAQGILSGKTSSGKIIFQLENISSLFPDENCPQLYLRVIIF